MKDVKLESKAMGFAIKKHIDQERDNGDPFINHPIEVANIIKILRPSDSNLIAAAYLHDTIEDTETTHEDLVKEFNQDVADLVYEVTHEGKKDYYGYYFPRLETQRGIVLKFADRTSNLAHMETWDEPRIAQYLRKSVFWRKKIGKDIAFTIEELQVLSELVEVWGKTKGLAVVYENLHNKLEDMINLQ